MSDNESYVGNKKLEDWMKSLGLDKHIPSAYELWKISSYYLKKGDKNKSRLYQNMNHVFHNSSIPATADIGKSINFAYGGIGLIIHFSSIIDDFATIGSNVTLGGRGGSKIHYLLDDGTIMTVPRIGKYTYIATGSKILGGVDIGPCSIIGANSLVIDHVPPCSIVAGTPAKVIGRITKDNFKKYKNNFTQFRNLNDAEILNILESYYVP
jgi:serine O-acetyltransferase